MNFKSQAPLQCADAIADKVIRALTECRFDLTNEKRLQEQVAQRLMQCGIQFKRESPLDSGDIPDFFADGLAIECKLRGQQKREIFRQLVRYAGHEQVIGVLLLTNVSMGLPSEINGKPTYFYSLGRGWL